MTEPQQQTNNHEQVNQAENRISHRKAKQAKYTKKWIDKNPEQYKALLKISQAAHREKRKCGYISDKYRKLAAEPVSKYSVKSVWNATELVRALQELGFYTQTTKMTNGFKVLKLRLAHE